MKNIKEITIENAIDGTLETHIIIDREDGSQVSMPKSVWDELQANQNNGGLN